MADRSSLRKLLQIKTAAKSTMTRIEVIVDIVQGWCSDDEEFKHRALSIGLFCEYAAAELQTIVGYIEEITDQPPSYGGSPDDRINQLEELDVVCGRAVNMTERLRSEVTKLRNDAMEEPETRLPETEERAYGVTKEVSGMAIIAEELLESELGGKKTKPKEKKSKR